MATSAIIRRNSFDRLRAMEYDQTESTYVCDCGNEYMNENALNLHKKNDCKNRSIKCSFCSETFPSSNLIRDHLLFCGNKTDQCPRCHQLIRRSHFAYHYENKCVSVDEIETPPSRIKNRSVHHAPVNLNMPFSRVDVPSNGYPEEYPGQKPSTNSPRGNGKMQLTLSNLNDSSMIIKCEFCHNECVRNDYRTHKDNCLKNPANINRKQTIAIPLRPNQASASSNGIVHIPCEICQQPIDLPNWSNHTQSCREREQQRLNKRAETINQESVTEQFPCEYCQQLYLAQQLHAHEKSCGRNPTNTVLVRGHAQRPQLSNNVFLPIKRQNNQSNPISPKPRSPDDPRFAQYQRIDIDRTHQANRSLDNERENSARRGRSNDNLSMRSNEILVESPREPNPHGISRRVKSSDNLRLVYDNQDLSNNSDGYPPRPPNNSRRHQNNINRKSERRELMNDNYICPKAGKKKKSW
ncbi:unnamed protein product [Rotaria socialis]|uniref:Uncharacterized protein n=1 Tax=Rotaria socialis TaxID=392032 RepID=A0A820Z7L9_9BILA|nr:unnamed protein product [Rotaria socialis]